MIEKTDIPGIIRDVSTGALLNTDKSDLYSYKKRKKDALVLRKLEVDYHDMRIRLEKAEKTIENLQKLVLSQDK